MDLSQLFSIYEMEKRNKHKLQELPESFYKKVSNLISTYKKTLEGLSPDSKQYRKLLLELDNLKELIKNIIYYRLEKIIKMAYFESKEGIRSSSINNLTREEEIIYKMLLSIFNSFRDNIINKVFSGESVDIDGFMENISKELSRIVVKHDLSLIVVVKDLEPIIGPDEKVYGPFKKEDIMIVPKEIAEKLESIGVCKIIKK